MTSTEHTGGPTRPRAAWTPAGVEHLDATTVVRTERVTPGMCGPNSLFASRLGDWTWDAVTAATGTDVYDAHNEDGAPVYLSFSYFRIRGSRTLHPLSLRFGDRLQVVSGVFGEGSESVLTLHRVRRDDGFAARPLDPVAFHTRPDPGDLRVENFNRWIARGRDGSNKGLVRAAPVGFDHRHLPVAPRRFSARAACARARRNGTFLDGPPTGHEAVVTGFTVDYPVEASRDLNGVGLLYFASYFAMLDWALLRLWDRLGRGEREFRDRTVLDQRICYLGNADADTTIRLTLTLWRNARDPAEERVEATLHDLGRDTALAVAELKVTGGGPGRRQGMRSQP
ncbi:LnmK family bifunctional acyltransferase/decarboxylase [Streptomyces tendae]|uniref:LnmK family bifunctional acyltransferase/decarboxylase n=1 Tax=Streptomyces tendae TaxID=1932 RepID=UPI0036954496